MLCYPNFHLIYISFSNHGYVCCQGLMLCYPLLGHTHIYRSMDFSFSQSLLWISILIKVFDLLTLWVLTNMCSSLPSKIIFLSSSLNSLNIFLTKKFFKHLINHIHSFALQISNDNDRYLRWLKKGSPCEYHLYIMCAGGYLSKSNPSEYHLVQSFGTPTSISNVAS